jgi:hypothetical protein
VLAPHAPDSISAAMPSMRSPALRANVFVSGKVVLTWRTLHCAAQSVWC